MMRNMKEMGMSNRDIAKELGVSRNTVGRMLKKTRIQDKKRKKRGSKLDPYREKICALIDEHNISLSNPDMSRDGCMSCILCRTVV